MHVLAEADTNSAGGYALNLDAKFRCRLFAYRSLQEFVCVIEGVRMRKTIAQREPDFSVVRMLRERLRII